LFIVVRVFVLLGSIRTILLLFWLLLNLFPIGSGVIEVIIISEHWTRNTIIISQLTTCIEPSEFLKVLFARLVE